MVISDDSQKARLEEIELEVYNPETKQILKTLPLKLIGPIK